MEKFILEIRDYTTGTKQFYYFTKNQRLSEILPVHFFNGNVKVTRNGKPLAGDAIPVNLDVLFITGSLLGGQKLPSKNPRDGKVRFGYVNIDSITLKHPVINPLMTDNDLDILFIAETKVDKFQSIPFPVVFHSDSVGLHKNYGMAVALNERYTHRDLNIVSESPYHIKVQFEAFNIVAIYIPSAVPDKHTFFIENLLKHCNENTILIGDFNMNLSAPRTTPEQLMLEDLLSLGLIYQDLEDTTYTFARVMNGTVQKSFIDHIICPLNDSVHIESAFTFPIACTYHLVLACQLNFCSVPLLPKNSKLKSYKLRKKETHDEFQQYLKANISRIRGEFMLKADVPFSHSNEVHQERHIKILEDLYTMLLGSIIDSAEKSVHRTKPVPYQTNVDVDALGREMILFYTPSVKGKQKYMKKKFLAAFQKSINALDSGQFLKSLKYRKRRKFTPKNMLDHNQLDTYMNQWFPKWNSPEYNNLSSAYPNLVSNSHCFSIDDLKSAIDRLPKGKTPGCDDLDGEILQHVDETCLELMLIFINLCLSLGHLPRQLRSSDIVPIYKKLSGLLIGHYRPIALSSHFRKLIEIMLKDKIEHIFSTSTNHYGYKKDTSICDALYDIQKKIAKLKKKKRFYQLVKLDVSGAFDELSRLAILDMILDADCPEIYKRILWKLAAEQLFRIRMGQFTSKTIGSNRGVIQGGITSPHIFIKTLDLAFSDWDSLRGDLFFFADDIFLITTFRHAQPLVDDISRRLASIGLTLAHDKTQFITADQPQAVFHKYLGYWINHSGCNVSKQVEKNIESARFKLRQLGRLGIFKNALDNVKLLKAFGSFIFPILEFGLLIWTPTIALAKPINVFIRSSIRSLTGTGRSCSISDLEIMFCYNNFYTRWANRHIAWHKYRCFKENDTDTLFQEKVKMTFKPHDKTSDLRAAYPGLQKFIQRQLPNRPITCPNCQQTHNYPNAVISCCFASVRHDQSMSLPETKTATTMLDLDSFMIANEAQLLDQNRENELLIYTDGGYSADYSSAAYAIIDANGITYKAFNISDLNIQSSTRAEIVAIVLALKDPSVQACRKPIVRIFTDSQPAIPNISGYGNHSNFRNIHSIDILTQLNLEVGDFEVKLHWIKGHSGNIGNELADLLCNLHSIHSTDHGLVLRENKYTKAVSHSRDPSTFPLFNTLLAALTAREELKTGIQWTMRRILNEYFSNHAP